MRKILYLVIIVIIVFPNVTYAEGEESVDSILKEQKSKFGISDFIKETKKYSPDFINDMDIAQIFDSALKGKIDNKKFFQKILDILFSEVKDTIKILINILVIVLIHSILKTIAEDLESENVSKSIYYVEYILIVTIIMSNFSEILASISHTIDNLVGFVEILIPILITLMLYTGSITTSGILEPILLFLIEFIGNIIQNLLLPVVSIIAVLVIISKISEKVQINKLSTFFKSSVTWFLGIILTLFVGVISLEGTLTSSVDGITAKTTKAAVSTLIPVVRKSTRGCCRHCFGVWISSKKCSRYRRSNYYNRNMHITNYKTCHI